MNIANELNPYRTSKLRAGMIAMMDDARFTHCISLNPNQGPRDLRTMERYFSDLCREIDRIVLGRHRVDRTASSDRFHAIAWVEHLQSNTHIHMVASLGMEFLGKKLDQRFKDDLWDAWRRVTRSSGTHFINPRHDSGWGRYITKEMRDPNHTFFMASDFHPHKSVIQYLCMNGEGLDFHLPLAA